MLRYQSFREFQDQLQFAAVRTFLKMSPACHACRPKFLPRISMESEARYAHLSELNKLPSIVHRPPYKHTANFVVHWREGMKYCSSRKSTGYRLSETPPLWDKDPSHPLPAQQTKGWLVPFMITHTSNIITPSSIIYFSSVFILHSKPHFSPCCLETSILDYQ